MDGSDWQVIAMNHVYQPMAIALDTVRHRVSHFYSTFHFMCNFFNLVTCIYHTKTRRNKNKKWKYT